MLSPPEITDRGPYVYSREEFKENLSYNLGHTG